MKSNQFSSDGADSRSWPPPARHSKSPFGMIFSSFGVPYAERWLVQRRSLSSQLAKAPVMSIPRQETSQVAKIHSLPDHILTNIFTALTFSSDESRLYAPDTLSHVSSHWRDVALNASALWTFIVVTFPFAPGQIDRAKAGLSRSKNRPIDVHIDVRDPDWSWELDEDQHQMRPVYMVEILEWLGSSHPRWRSLTVLTDTWTPMHTFLAYSTMFSSLPELERLSLNRCNAFTGLPCALDPVPSDPVELFGGNAYLPRLRHVTLAGVHVDYSCTGFKDLLSLDLGHQPHGVSPTIRQFHRLLHESPGLKSLSLVALNPPSAEPARDDGSPVCLEHLKNLTLGWWFVEDAIRLLDALQLPVVEDLILEDLSPSLLQHDHIVRDSTPILNTLVEMGNRPYNPALPSSFPSHLRRLTINGTLLDPAAFSQFIPFLANLEELELKSVKPDVVGAVGCGEGVAGMEEESSSVETVILRLR